MGGWVGVKAVLRIAYSNQKLLIGMMFLDIKMYCTDQDMKNHSSFNF
jgi:hypothetical protein